MIDATVMGAKISHIDVYRVGADGCLTHLRSTAENLPQGSRELPRSESQTADGGPYLEGARAPVRSDCPRIAIVRRRRGNEGSACRASEMTGSRIGRRGDKEMLTGLRTAARELGDVLTQAVRRAAKRGCGREAVRVGARGPRRERTRRARRAAVWSEAELVAALQGRGSEPR